MRKNQKIAINTLCALTLIILAIALIFSISGGLQFPFIAIVIAILAFLIIKYKKQSLRFAKTIFSNKYIIIAVVVLSIIARLAPLLFNFDYLCENNLSDTGVHYFGAQQLAQGKLDANIAEYEKTFPYLYPYTLFLSIFYKIFSNINVAIVLSNIILDCLSGIFIYLLLAKFSSSSKKIGIILWSINPFSIIMCWLPLNIVLVNCLITALLLIGSYILDGKSTLWSILFGIIIFISNLFRPIFTVLLIALIIAMFCYNTLNIKKKFICALLILLFAFVPSAILNNVIRERYNDDILGSSGGWSFFVGSNYATYGQWSRTDCDYYWGSIAPKNEKISDAQKEIKRQGVERYKQMGPLKLINHLANKLSVLFQKISTSIYDIRHAFGIADNTMLYKILASLVGIFFSMLVFLTILYVQTKSGVSHLSLFLCLSILGFTAAFLIVEVMNRYSAVFFALLVPLASVSLANLIYDHRNKRKIIK